MPSRTLSAPVNGVPDSYHRGSNRRSQKAHDATIEATVTLLMEIGYHDLTIEGIAARAGVGKATIYRWWPSKAALVLDALIASLTELEYKPTDSVRDDLYRRMELSSHRFTLDGIAMSALVADLWHGSPDLLEKYRNDWIGPQRAGMYRDLKRAIDAGLLPEDADIELIMDVWTGTTIFRSILTGAPYDPRTGRQLVDCMLAAAPRVLPAGGRRQPVESDRRGRKRAGA